MKVQLTELEIQLTEIKGKFSYRLFDIKVEGFATRELAIEHAEKKFSKILTNRYFKRK